jgi:Leucine-rich repeat (LRR) protein
MEDFDELVQAPNAEGVLDLSHHAWVTLEDAVWGWGETLLVFNASFNKIPRLPPKLGQLVNLRELDVSNNQLDDLPNEIGLCLRLRKLFCKGNHLRTLPGTLGQCRLLEEIRASENQMMALPASLGELAVLRVLHVQNNRLEELPPELANCLSLEDINATGNKDIANVPQKVLGDTHLILWQCKHNLKQKRTVHELEQQNEELEKAAELTDENEADLREVIDQLKKDNERLLRERPERFLRYLARYNKLREAARESCCIS